MEWIIEKSLVCPVTGTGFSLAAAAKNLKLIIWYTGEYFLRTGTVIHISKKVVTVNGKPVFVNILHIFPYAREIWQTLAQRILCPGNNNPLLQICNQMKTCKFTLCPYGAVQPRDY